MQKKRKAQASMEYIVIIGIVLVLLIPLFYFAINKSSESIKVNQAEQVVQSLSQAADEVYTLGSGTKKYVWVSIPGSVQSTSVGDSEIVLVIGMGEETSDIVGSTKAPVTGSIPLMKGTYKISVEHLETGFVLIGVGNDTTAPSITWVYPSVLACNPITLRANTNEPASCKFDTTDTDFNSMDTLMSGSAIGHNYDLGVQAESSYKYYVRCQDAAGNTMNTSTMINYSIDYQACGENGSGGGVTEYDPPIVSLINPSNGYISNSSRVDFYYNVTDQSAILLCELLVDDVVINTIYAPLKDVTNTITGDLDLGTYQWSINCTDAFGNEGNSSTRSVEINATLDVDLPVVTLVSPVDGTVRNFNLIKFFYNVTDITSGIRSCTLSILGILDAGGGINQQVTDNSIVEGDAESLSLTLNQGNYTWNISCEDDSVYRNLGLSESWWLRVNSTTEEAFLTSCAGVCGYEGYSNGVCENNVAKCGEYCPGCYYPEGDQFCTGGSQSDTCCCVP
ncbi:MAG: hypothetical protein KKH52_04600 [Nanoarchaeota archaeon]|nr:hypothetical protein [Nanoarchaeota archaeon]MBU1622542.1 hypothetical protein [Nanoarchaeota archaeon]MBU1974646.1 hypothetical protein [Nanoarchaeota archaeon]